MVLGSTVYSLPSASNLDETDVRSRLTADKRVFIGLSTSPHAITRSPLAQPGGISPHAKSGDSDSGSCPFFANHQDVEASRFNVILCRVLIGGTLGEIAHDGVLSPGAEAATDWK